VSASPDSVLSLLQRLDAVLEPKARQQLAEALVDNVYSLGIAIERGAVAREELLGLAAAAEPVLPRVSVDLQGVVDDIELRFMLSFEPGDWESLLQLRSGLEFLLEVFPARAEWVMTHVRPDAHDELIRRRSHDFGYLRPSEIPPGIPLSHWWWWAPIEPGESLNV
jgi:hypothetical protein